MTQAGKQIEDVLNLLQTELPKDQPYLMSIVGNEIHIYDDAKHYRTIISQVTDTDLWLTSLQRIGVKPKEARYPIYRKAEKIINDLNNLDMNELDLRG